MWGYYRKIDEELELNQYCTHFKNNNSFLCAIRLIVSYNFFLLWRCDHHLFFKSIVVNNKVFTYDILPKSRVEHSDC